MGVSPARQGNARLSVLINSDEVWFATGGNVILGGETTGQVTLSAGENFITFVGEEGGVYSIIRTNLTDDECIDLSE